jgi:glutathionylspermidine synthase
MNEVTKYVTVRELYEILLKRSGKNVEYDDFLHQLSITFLASPALEHRFHDRDEFKKTDTVYILKHQELAKALEEKTMPPVPKP